jgi:hypothetical protein
VKTLTLRIGGVVLASQFAYVTPAANLVWKQMKSLTLSIGAIVEPSRLA